MTFIPLTKWKSGFCSTAFSKKVLHKNECNWSTCILMSICLYTTDENGHSVFHKICSQINFCRIFEAPTHAMNRREFLSRFGKKLQKWTMWIFRTLIQNDLVYNILQTWLNALQLNFKKQSTQPQLKHSRGLAGVMYLGAGSWGCDRMCCMGGLGWFGIRMDKSHHLYFIHESCHCADGVLASEDGSHGGNVRTDVL